jgi:hypothetical protein
MRLPSVVAEVGLVELGHKTVLSLKKRALSWSGMAIARGSPRRGKTREAVGRCELPHRSSWEERDVGWKARHGAT